MNLIREISKALSINSLLIALCAIEISQQQPALSQPKDLIAIVPEDFVCYMQTSDGRVLNLSKLCQSKQPAALSTIDQKFMQRYLERLSQRAQGLPTVQTLIAQSQQNPQIVIQRARAICTAMRTGQPQPQFGEQIGDDLFQTMAPKYYCPELED